MAGFQGQQGEVRGRDDQRGLLVARGARRGRRRHRADRGGHADDQGGDEPAEGDDQNTVLTLVVMLLSAGVAEGRQAQGCAQGEQKKNTPFFCGETRCLADFESDR